jgi:L-fuculokinase
MTEVTAIFDVGKTNKKLLLFDHKGCVVDERIRQLPIITDDDGYPCEDITEISKWLHAEWKRLLASKKYKVTGVNFTAFGASFVHLNSQMRVVAPLYDYMRPVGATVVKSFYTFVRKKTGQAMQEFIEHTCSPKLGMLNSGFQLYWLKKTKPFLWASVAHSLHLPQYLAYLLSGKLVSDYTSIGCHTALWDFPMFRYSAWVNEFTNKLPPITTDRSTLVHFGKKNIPVLVGNGLHDSSSALIPYLKPKQESFILISTGTWSIQLNPFNVSPLTNDQLRKDCLCYLQANGKQVKASRLLLGREHDYQLQRITEYFQQSPNFHLSIPFDETIFWKVKTLTHDTFYPACMIGTGPFPQTYKRAWDLSVFENAAEAYHGLLTHLVLMLKTSIQLIDTPRVKTLYVDGGFARNVAFMKILAYSLYQKEVYASHLPQSTALGAYLHLHGLNARWSDNPKNFVQYQATQLQIT